MKILLTGGTGFLGKNFISKNYNNKRYQIFSIQRKKSNNNKNTNYISCDLNNKKKLISVINDINPSFIIHFSWQGIPNFNKSNCKKNFKMSKNLIDAAFQSKSCKKIIIAGTCKEYEGIYGYGKESMKINPHSNFAKTKKKILQYLKVKANNNKKIDWYWIRIFYIYGLHQRAKSLIPYCIKKIKNNKNIELDNYNQANDYINIKFLIKTINHIAIYKIKRGVYNLGSGEVKTNLKIENICLKIFRKKELKEKLHTKLPYIRACMKKFYKNFGWKPKENILKGIKEIKSFNG